MNSEFIVAVHAMVFLHHKADTLSSETLAENVCTNPVRIRRVLAKLKKAGLVETREGRTAGGYSYQKTRQSNLGADSKGFKCKVCRHYLAQRQQGNELSGSVRYGRIYRQSLFKSESSLRRIFRYDNHCGRGKRII